MAINIIRGSGMPLYLQLRNEIIKEVQSGSYTAGHKLMTEREMANQLKVSRKTVSHAYNLLEEEGILESIQGKGTFVSMHARVSHENIYNEKMIKHIDIAIDQFIKMGMTKEEFLSRVRHQISENVYFKSAPRAIFIECNTEQAQGFAKQLSGEIEMELIPLIIRDLKEMTDSTRTVVENAKVIIPTFNHVGEVKEILKSHGFKKKVMGVAITPDLEVIVQIAEFTPQTRFGLVSLTKEFYKKVEFALSSAGLNRINIEPTITIDENDLKNFLQDKDVIIVSPGREEDVRSMVKSSIEVIKFDYSLDSGSVKVIEASLIDALSDKE